MIHTPLGWRRESDFIGTQWQNDALCKDHPNPDLWHPESKTPSAQAIQICHQCPVRQPCLEYALKHRETGIWGACHLTDADSRRAALKGAMA